MTGNHGARGIVRDASRILQTGAVAASKPVSAKKVSAVAEARFAKVTGAGGGLAGGTVGGGAPGWDDVAFVGCDELA